jgi:apolipoprotein N-acyltransferase
MILSIISGILFGVSMPGMPLHPLIWISFIPLLISLKKSRPILGGINGMIFFMTSFLISHFWILDTITTNFPRFAGFTKFQGFLVFLLLLAFESSFYFLFGFLAPCFQGKIHT